MKLGIKGVIDSGEDEEAVFKRVDEVFNELVNTFETDKNAAKKIKWQIEAEKKES